MKRRSFLQLTGLAAAVGAAPAVGAATTSLADVIEGGGPLVHLPFRQADALRHWCVADLSEISLEEAIIALVKDSKQARLPLEFTLVVPSELMFVAARLCVEIHALQLSLPKSIPASALPRVDYRVDDSMLLCDEWGVVAANGRCFYSPGV